MLDQPSFHPLLRNINCDANSICKLISYAPQGEKANLDVVRMLHHAGAKIDEQDGGTGDTPLIRALLTHRDDIAKYLVKAGANPMQTKKFGVSAFVVASAEGTPEIIDDMIQSGAKVNQRTKLPDMTAPVPRDRALIDGVTPLMVAAGSGRADLVETLLKNGADASLVDERGLGVLAYAKQGRFPKTETEVAAILKRYADEK